MNTECKSQNSIRNQNWCQKRRCSSITVHVLSMILNWLYIVQDLQQIIIERKIYSCNQEKAHLLDCPFCCSIYRCNIPEYRRTDMQLRLALCIVHPGSTEGDCWSRIFSSQMACHVELQIGESFQLEFLFRKDFQLNFLSWKDFQLEYYSGSCFSPVGYPFHLLTLESFHMELSAFCSPQMGWHA